MASREHRHVNVGAEEVARARRTALRAASMFRLPFRRELWRGTTGSWAGAGIGSAVDYQDHRPYVPGDDPRHIDWQAYARSEHYVMKLYREEVAPMVDLILDPSASMAVEPAKKQRTLELLYFVVENALAGGARLRVWTLSGGDATMLNVESVLSGVECFGGGAERVDHTILDRVELRSASLRVLVSDCLFEGDPTPIVRRLTSRRGRGLVLAPSSPSESEPDWAGQVELLDCETGRKRVETMDDVRVDRYRDAYRRHFALWEGTCVRHGASFLRVSSELALEEVLRSDAVRIGAVEPAT